MRIGEVAKSLGTSTRTIRYYESLGLIDPQGITDGGYRTYGQREIVRLDHILSLRQLGFSLEDISRLLQKLEQKDSSDAELFRALIAWQLQAIEQQLTDLNEAKGALEQLDLTLQLNDREPLRFAGSIAKTLGRNREARRNWRDAWDFDRLAATYDQTIGPGQVNYDPHECYDETLRFVASRFQAGITVADIGIGTGNLALLLQEQGCKVVGIDQSREMLRLAKQKLPDAELLEGNFLALPLPDATVDGVATTYALHHLNEAEKALAINEMLRVLRPGGQIAIGDNMFANEAARNARREQLLSSGQTDVWEDIEDEYLGFAENLCQHLERQGRRAVYRQLADYTFVVWTE